MFVGIAAIVRSSRDLEEMMLERGLSVDHSTVHRWVLKYASEFEQRIRPHLKPTNDSWRVDETYIKVKGQWKYLYGAVDSFANTLDFLLRGKRDASLAQRFFRKVLNISHSQMPRVINVERNAAYPPAIEQLKADKQLPKRKELRQVKYLNNSVEQDHRFIKRLSNPGMGFGSFDTARRTGRGIKAMQRTGSQRQKRGNYGTDLFHQSNLWSCCLNYLIFSKVFSF